MESFEPGSTVVVVSLVSRSDLNGRRGIVHNFVSGSGRYGVQVDGEQASIALKPGNLQPAPALGSTVILVSLVSRSDLNGRRGIVHGLECETTRYEVKVDGEEAILSLKPQNLREVVSSSSGTRGERTAAQERVLEKVEQLAQANSWLALSSDGKGAKGGSAAVGLCDLRACWHLLLLSRSVRQGDGAVQADLGY